MRIKSFLGMGTLACVFLASQAANAGVKFVSVYAKTEAYAAAWNGVADNQKVKSKSQYADTDKLGKAKKGISSSIDLSVVSGSNKQASAADREDATVTLASKFDASIDFSGATSAAITDNAPNGAYANAGGYHSDAAYTFRATSLELLQIDYLTTSDIDEADAYEVIVYKGKKGHIVENDFVDANDSGSLSLLLDKGLYTVEVYLQQPIGLSAGVGDMLEARYQGAFDVRLSAVPEISTWAMLLVGFGGLSAAAAWRRRVTIA